MSATTSDVSITDSGSGPRRAAPPPAPPELPPAQAISKPAKQALPNWALKITMAITGTIWATYLVIHLFGNLKIYTGAEHFNQYAAWLRHVFEPFFPYQGVLWILRVVLITALISHVVSAVILWTRGRRARGPFKAKRTSARSFSASMMPITGVLILAFVTFHVLDLTIGWQPLAPEGYLEHTTTTSSAYQNLVASFSRPWSALVYIGMMVLLAMHIAHGALTAAFDMGAMGRRVRAVITAVGALIAAAVLLGNASIPISVLAGWLS